MRMIIVCYLAVLAYVEIGRVFTASTQLLWTSELLWSLGIMFGLPVASLAWEELETA
jgi:hypothetical protein